MDDGALADIAAALRRTPAEVIALHEEALLLPALIARALIELRGGQGDHHDPAGARFCSLLLIGWGTREFLATQLLSWIEQQVTPEQRAVHAAARALCRLEPDADLTAQMLGLRLRQIAENPPATGPRVESCGSRRGSSLWCVRDRRD